jgi:transglutaminase-like putative cysteine protease
MAEPEPVRAGAPGAQHAAPTAFIGAGHPSVRAFAERAVAGAVTERERISRFFFAVRDEIRYDRAYME